MVCSVLHLEQRLSCILVPAFRYIMVEMTILKEIYGFCDTTSLLYTNGAKHVDLLLEILFNAQILCKILMFSFGTV